MKGLLNLALLLALVLVASASHFSGGTISWYSSTGAAGTDNVTFVIRTGFFLGLGPCGLPCPSSMLNKLAPRPRYQLTCLVGGCTYISGPLSYYLTSIDNTENLEAGEITSDGVFNSSVPGPFEIGYQASAWSQLTLINKTNQFYRLATTVNLGVRSDTGRINSSPKTSLPFMNKIPHNCNNIKISIPVIDKENDKIGCRWATSAESLGIVNQFPGSTLDSTTCVITVNTTTANGYVASGTYGVGIQIEDFPKSTLTLGSRIFTTSDAMSSVPLQFLVRLIAGVNCNSIPTFTGTTPSANAEYGIAVNGALSLQITAINAQDNTANGTITEILITAPIGVQRTNVTAAPSVGTGAGYVNISFSPSTADAFVICFTAKDQLGRSSETRCVKVVSGVTCPDPGQLNYATRQPSATQTFMYGEGVLYTCNSGQAVVPGNRYRTCQIDGTWNGTAMVCSSSGGSGAEVIRPAFHLLPVLFLTSLFAQ